MEQFQAIHLGNAASVGAGVIVSIATIDNAPLAMLTAFNPQGSIIFCIFLQSEGLVCAIRYHGFLFQTTLMLTSDEVVKEQIFQKTSKKDYSKSIIGNSRISFVVNSPIFFSVKDNFLFFTNLSSWNAYS